MHASTCALLHACAAARAADLTPPFPWLSACSPEAPLSPSLFTSAAHRRHN